MYTTGYIYTFQVSLLERHRKDYQLLLNEIMLPSGIGFKNFNQKRFFQKAKVFQNSQLMKHYLKLDQIMFGFDGQPSLSLQTGKFQHYPYLKKETCLQQRGLLQIQSKIMESILYQQRWRHLLVSTTSLQVLETKTPYSFNI